MAAGCAATCLPPPSNCWTRPATNRPSRLAAAEPRQAALPVRAGSLAACVEAGRSTSTGPYADAVALWLGLHGLAHQRALATSFPWPNDITDRLIDPLARLRPVATKKRTR